VKRVICIYNLQAFRTHDKIPITCIADESGPNSRQNKHLFMQY